jgi:hypothetical protein
LSKTQIFRKSTMFKSHMNAEGIKSEIMASDNFKVNKNITTMISKYLRTRFKLSISVKDKCSAGLRKVFNCLCGQSSTMDCSEKKIYLYERAKSKLTKDLDCVDFLRKIKKIENLLSLVLDSKQRLLLFFNRKNVVKHEDDYSSSDEEKFDNTNFLKDYYSS